MRKDITVAAEPRETRGKNAARRLRMAGKIPAVVYGPGGDSVAVSVSPKEVNRILHSSTGHNTIFDLGLGEAKTPVMVVDWLHDPIKSNLLHVDLLRIDLSKKLRVKVPVHYNGDPVGVKIQGGIFEVLSRELEVVCLPDDIPEFLDVNIQPMNIGDSVRGKDVALPANVALAGHGDIVLAHVIATRGSVETAGGEGAAAEKGPEPEVIKKGKKEEEGGAEEKKKK